MIRLLGFMLMLSVETPPQRPYGYTLSLEAHCNAKVDRAFLHCGCTAAFVETEFSPADGVLAIDLLAVSFPKVRGTDGLGARAYEAHPVEHVNRVAQRMLAKRLALATLCPLNFPSEE